MTDRSDNKPEVRIVYCTGCNWLLRSGWLAQELLQTFTDELASVTLQPGSGGCFEIWLDSHCLWERKRDGGFPDAAELKRRVRDQMDPARDLGHLDRDRSDGSSEG